MAADQNAKKGGWLNLGKGSRWDANSDFGKSILLGFAFIAVVIVVLLPWMHFEMKYQRESYEAAVKILDGKSLREPPIQRAALLTKKEGIYHWRMLIWEQQGDEFVPRVFSASVDKAHDYRVIETSMAPYKADDYNFPTR